jgi:hypothetical protein
MARVEASYRSLGDGMNMATGSGKLDQKNCFQPKIQVWPKQRGGRLIPSVCLISATLSVQSLLHELINRDCHNLSTHGKRVEQLPNMNR